MRLAELTSIFRPNDDPSEKFAAGGVDHMLATIRSHLGMDVAFTSHVADGEILICDADVGGDLPLKAGDRFPAEDSYCRRIIEGRIPFLIPDTAAVSEVASLPYTRDLPIGSHLSVPLRLSDGSIYGTFCCFSHLPNYSLNARDLQMMEAFAELAAAQIEARISREARVNEATAKIEQIIDQDVLTMAYQPIYKLASNEVVGVECLARFPDSQTRSPDTWFAEAADVGLGVKLEMLAVRAALRGMKYFPDDIYLAINVSPDLILNGQLASALEGVPPGRVLLEVTEHAVVADYVRLKRALRPLRKLARLAIDDAGAGYSGLRHILEMKPDIIKLDMSLTRGIDNDPARHALATALVTFANEVGSQIVAEGIETSQELQALEGLEVTFGQGYFLRKPMPISVAAQFLIARELREADEKQIGKRPSR
jgi:EAL domain-containing protein (putative c-di-GMP-specific phosphodiesterase class I)